jgi:hypothetical protein
MYRELLSAKQNKQSYDEFMRRTNRQYDINRLEFYALMNCPKFNHDRTSADVFKFINGLRRPPINIFNEEESACSKALRQLNAALKQYDDLQTQFQNHYTKWLDIQKEILEKLEEKQVSFEKLFGLRFYYEVPWIESGNTYEKYLIAKAKYPDKILIKKDIFKGTDYVHRESFNVMGLSPLFYRIIFDDGFQVVKFGPLEDYQRSQLQFIDATKPVAPSPFHFEQFVCQECRNIVDLKDVKSIEDSKFQQYLQCVMNIGQKPIQPIPPPEPSPQPQPIPPPEPSPQPQPIPPPEPSPQPQPTPSPQPQPTFLQKYGAEIIASLSSGILLALILK